MKVFRDPASVAVVGASDNPAKWGHWLARGALSGVERRRVYLVNARQDMVLGQSSYRTLTALPEIPELVVVAVPAWAAVEVAHEAAALGVGGLVGITAGLRFSPGDMRVIGPNCLGIYDSSTELSLAWGTFTPGPLGIVSQSGQVGLEIAGLAAAQGIGVSRFVSVGDQLDVTINDVLDDLVDHQPTRIVALYAEDFGDGRTLVDTLTRLAEAGKRTIVLTVGRTEASRSAARSHTGALTTPLDIVDAACRAAGAVRVDTPAEVAALVQLLVHMEVAGDRLAIVSDSGGQGAIAADMARGLKPGPPIDLAGAGERDMMVYSRIVNSLTESREFDTVLITGYFGCYGLDAPELLPRELDVIDSLQGNIVVHSMADGGAAVDALRRKGIPVYREIGSALTALDGGGRSPRPRKMPEIGGLPGCPPPGYLAARKFLSGVPFPRCVEGPGVGDLRPPYVLKADWIAHKTEAAAVVLGLADQDAVSRAYADLVSRLGPGRYVVEEMDTRSGAVELIVGARRDPSFGPVVMVGAGGVLAELLRDTVTELAPVEPWLALAMVRRLKCAPLLEGWRGQSPVDVEGVASLIVEVSRVIADRDDIQDLELNPVRVTASGPLAVDALINGVAQ